MAGREDETVAVGPVGAGGVELQVPGEEDGGDVGHAHGHPGMARIGGGDGVQREGADRGGAAPMVRIAAPQGLYVHGCGPFVADRMRTR